MSWESLPHPAIQRVRSGVTEAGTGPVTPGTTPDLTAAVREGAKTQPRRDHRGSGSAQGHGSGGGGGGGRGEGAGDTTAARTTVTRRPGAAAVIA